MDGGSTYCVCHSRRLKHPLQAIKWDVKPLNPLSSLQVLSEYWIIWCLHLRPSGTTGNEARGRRHCAHHLLSISWLNFHCCRETVSLPPRPPTPFPFRLVLGGEVYCVRWIRRGEEARERQRELWEGEEWRWRGSSWGSSLSGRLSGLCRHTEWLEERGGEKKKFTGEFFFPPLSSLPCNYSYVHRSLCKLTCGLRKANWDTSCLSRPKEWRQREGERRVAAREERRRKEEKVLLIL